MKTGSTRSSCSKFYKKITLMKVLFAPQSITTKNFKNPYHVAAVSPSPSKIWWPLRWCRL